MRSTAPDPCGAGTGAGQDAGGRDEGGAQAGRSPAGRRKLNEAAHSLKHAALKQRTSVDFNERIITIEQEYALRS